ncbi:MAG TPA: 50S ribosomal protein L11 methyltransferase [Allosphingosinicella sp.]|nr:50S ribosomal protein L11 methyltransferase [Allosphingosinicella sp.]
MTSWRVTLPCTKAEAEAIALGAAELEGLDPPPVLMTSEPDPTRPEQWRLDAYFEAEPDAAALASLRALAPSAAGAPPEIAALGDEDWVTMSQSGLEPIEAGRFFVHTPAHRGRAPPGAIAIEIDAGRAFGTGQHETSTGCLVALDRLEQAGIGFGDIVDLGTGTGLLAFAALKLWPEARVTASDIDPVAVEVAAANAAVNDVPLGPGPGEVELVVAPGLEHERLAARAPYDLAVANILAGPLVELAPSIAAAMAPGGHLILAGLLTTQAEAITAAYQRQGLAAAFAIERGDWPTLVMTKGRE